jgi:uroporphyrin-III C-methyltransferase/precorrin-2 dehydrogenase/sirohydrochlorin ferrochelatase
MHSLPLFVNITGQPIILIGTGEAADAKRRLIERAGGLPVDESDERARIAFVALEDAAQATDAATRLKARGLLVNVVDRPDLCDFTTPAIVDRDPVLIAVATGGVSAGLAAALRQRLEDLLPGHLGQLATDLHAARAAIRETWPDPADRRRAIAGALAPGGQLDPLGSQTDIALWLSTPPDARRTETMILRPRSPNPDELTVRDARALGLADRIIHDGRAPQTILARARADAVRIVQPADAPVPDAPGLTIILDLATM